MGISEIVSLARAAQSLTTDTLEKTRALIVGIEISAAIEAYEKAFHAQNQSAQVWSAVTHLESAESALLDAVIFKYYKNVGFIGFASPKLAFNVKGLTQSFYRLVLLYIALAVLYRALGEKKLWVRSLIRLDALGPYLEDFAGSISAVNADSVASRMNVSEYKYASYEKTFKSLRQDATSFLEQSWSEAEADPDSVLLALSVEELRQEVKRGLNDRYRNSGWL